MTFIYPPHFGHFKASTSQTFFGSTDSDIDIWIKIRTTSDENLASLSSLIHRNLENSKIVFVTVEKMQEEMVSAPARFGQDITIGFVESSLISRVLPFFSPGGNC
ncbi:MAG: hypothetical protein KAW14_07275 [Candidatus Aegiribacteria sp.]|nr:hypothetical protein [Candidatus Aegiribacteria sp.]